MRLGKKFNLVGLDIGSRTIKAGEIVDGKSGPTLKSFGSIDIPPGTIEEGNIVEPARVADAIRQMYKKFGIKENNVAISIGGYSVIVKKITVQTMEEEQLQETINLEAEQYIPFDIADVNLDFQILGENEHNANQMNVLLVAAKKEMINDYVKLIQMAKLNPCVIDIDAFALQNIYEHAYLKPAAPAESGENNVAISIGGYSVIVKKITVQTMEEEQLQETINLEAEQYIPFDIADVNLDFQILGENEHNANQMNVLLVAAKKEMINDYVKLIQMAKLNPCVIDIDAFALQNVYEHAYLKPAAQAESGENSAGAGEGESVALIDIGASKTSLNILKDRSSVFMRDVSLGCGQINQKIIQMIECTPEEAEDLKFAPDPEMISADDLREIVSSVVADWCTEIRRALDFFYSTYPDDQIQKIILSGGGGNISEFRELLAVETSADVETINPFAGLYVDPDKFDSDYIQKMAPQAAICMGLSLRKVDDK